MSAVLLCRGTSCHSYSVANRLYTKRPQLGVELVGAAFIFASEPFFFFIFPLVVVLACSCDACAASQRVPNVREILKCIFESERLAKVGSASRTNVCSHDRRCHLSVSVLGSVRFSSD